MHYISPITIFGPTFQAPLDPRIVRQERKKLLANLELAGSDTIRISGYSFTKNELLAWFDELEQPNIAGYHQAILEDQVLLEFLQAAPPNETATAAGTTAPDNRTAQHQITTQRHTTAQHRPTAIYADSAFIAWLSPYFYSACTKHVTNALEHHRPGVMRFIFENPLLMTPTQSEQLRLFIIGILEKNIALFEHYKFRNQPGSQPMMPLNRITAFVHRDYIDVIRELPDDRFPGWKDKYAISIQYAAIAAWNRDGRYTQNAVRWLRNAEQLAVSDHTRSILQTKRTDLETLLKKAGKKRLLKTMAFSAMCLAAGIGLVVLGFIYRLPGPIFPQKPPPPTLQQRAKPLDSVRTTPSTRSPLGSPRHSY